MNPSLDALLALVAAEGLPRREPPAPTTLDDTTFAALHAAVARERITGHLDRALDAGWLRASDAQRDDVLGRHEAALSVDLTLERLLVDTSRRLTEAGIPHRALKGPVVTRTAYPDPALRSFGDVDILVDGSRFDAAVALLERGGGHARYREPRRSFTARYGKGVCVVTRDGLEIDLHRVFVAGPFGLAIDPADLFVAPEDIEIGASTVPAPSANVRFLHACYHVALTSPRLTATRDVAQIVTLTDLDLDAALAARGAVAGPRRRAAGSGTHASAAGRGPRRPGVRVGHSLPARSLRACRAAAVHLGRAQLRNADGGGRVGAARCPAPRQVRGRVALARPHLSQGAGRELRQAVGARARDRPRIEGRAVSATFSCLGFDFGVVATNLALQRVVDALYVPFRSSVDVTTQFTLVERTAPGPTGMSILIFENDRHVRTAPDRAPALAHLVWRVSQHVVAVASESYLLLHAAAVERGEARSSCPPRPVPASRRSRPDSSPPASATSPTTSARSTSRRRASGRIRSRSRWGPTPSGSSSAAAMPSWTTRRAR